MTGKQKIFFNMSAIEVIHILLAIYYMNVIEVIHILLAIYSPVPTCREGEDLIVGVC